MDIKKGLERNLKLYYIYKIFLKRTYLPLIAVYLVNDSKITLQEIAVIATITTIVQMCLDLPSGYFADKLGHRTAMLIGSFSLSISSLFYIIFPNFLGGLLASLFFFGGASFLSGAMQAFIHDSLRALGRELEYAKLMGRAQSYSLVGNMILVALVPLTWSIDHRLPFLLGFIFSSVCFVVVLLFKNPPEERLARKEISLLQTVKNIPVADLIFLLTLFGVVSAAFDVAPSYRELVFAHLGIPVSAFGFILAAGSLFAAVAGQFVHKLAKITPKYFYIIDAGIVTLILIAIGLAPNPFLAVIAFLFIPAYDRNRGIVAETHMLMKYPDHTYKATLLSVLDFYPKIHNIWIPLIMAYFLTHFGIQKGYATFAIVLIPIFIILYVGYLITNRLQRTHV